MWLQQVDACKHALQPMPGCCISRPAAPTMPPGPDALMPMRRRARAWLGHTLPLHQPVAHRCLRHFLPPGAVHGHPDPALHGRPPCALPGAVRPSGQLHHRVSAALPGAQHCAPVWLMSIECPRAGPPRADHPPWLRLLMAQLLVAPFLCSCVKHEDPVALPATALLSCSY